MAKANNTRSKRKSPSPQAIAWHAAVKETKETINSANELIRTFGGYSRVLKDSTFIGALTAEQVTALTASVNVVRTSGAKLLDVLNPAQEALKVQIDLKHTDRMVDNVRVIDAQCIDAVLHFNETAIDSGHVDNVRQIVEDTLNTINSKAVVQAPAEDEAVTEDAPSVTEGKE